MKTPVHCAAFLSLAAIVATLLAPTGMRAQDAYTLDNDSVTVSGSLWTIAGTNINIGYNGWASLAIDSTGTLSSSGTAFIGRNAGSSGTTTISGIWKNTGPLYVGNEGAGTLIIETGGTLISAETSRVGFAATGTGDVIVRGYWNNASTLVLGGTGKATLEVASTGTLLTGNFYGSDYDGSESYITVAGYMQTGAAYIGQRGLSTVDILAGGTMMTSSTTQHILLGNTAAGVGIINVKDGGYLYSGNQIRVGVVASGTGVLNIESGALVEANLGVYASLGNGYGVINIATGGTLIINANALYVGNGGAANVGTYGEVNIDGYVRSGGNGTYYTPVGYAGIGVLNIGATGTMFAGPLDVGREATASGTVNIAGYYKSTSTGTTFAGNAGTGSIIIGSTGYFESNGPIHIGSGANGSGYLEVQQSGTLYYTTTRDFFIGGAVAGTATGTAVIGGSVINANTVYIGNNNSTNNTLIIKEGGYLQNNANSWYARNAGNSTTLVSGTNAAYVAGTWDTGGYLVIGNNTGHNILDIATTGTVIARTTGIRVTYARPDCTAYVNVDGYMEAANGTYIIVAHYGNSIMRVGATGTVVAGSYISIGQGDYWNNALAPANYRDAAGTYSGTVFVDGYMASTTQLQVGNRLKGYLGISTSGTVIAGSHGLIGMGNDGSPNAFGHVDVAGYLKYGTYLTNGGNGYGLIDIKATGNVFVGTNYTQNARSTLRVEIDVNRPADTIDPTTYAPPLVVGGAATLSGTLHVKGSAVATIPEFQWDSNGFAKASTLTGVPILRASGGITGDFDKVQVDGLDQNVLDALPDFIKGGGLKVNEGGPSFTRYDVGYGLAWKGSEAAASGNFTIDANRTFDVDVQLADRPGIVFATGWDGISLTKKGDGTLILSVENTYTGATTIESGTLRFAGPAIHRLTSLVNNGVIDFYATNSNGARIGGYRTIQANSLAGNGTYRMDVNLSTGASDHLVILGDATGYHRLLITGGGDLPTGDEPTPTLVTIGGVNNTDIIVEGEIIGSGTFSGNFDYGLFKYEVQTLGHKVVIANTGMKADILEHIRGVPGAQSVLWFDQQDNMGRRLGELRAPRPNGIGLDAWARGHASSGSIGGTSDMLESDIDIWGAEIGTDYTWKLDDQLATIGIFAGIGNASQKFERLATSTAADAKSTGESDMIGIGVYGSWLSESGWFANTTATLAQYKNSFDSVDDSYNYISPNYKDHGFGATVEGGRRFAISSNGWFIEPAVQGAIARLTRADYKIVYDRYSEKGSLSVHGSDTTITRVRGAIRAGRAWQAGRAGWMQIAGRLAATRERSSGGEVGIGADRWRPNLDGNRYEAGVGFFWQPFETGQLYFDYEYASGDNFTKPWGISLGFRLSL